MKTIKLLPLFIILSNLLSIDLIGQENDKGGSNLFLYATGGMNMYNVKNLSHALYFANVADEKQNIKNLGAGFTSSFGQRFSIGADYIFGTSKQVNDNQIIEGLSFETPVFVEYKLLNTKGFSLAPQVGINYTFLRFSYFDKQSSTIALNSNSVKQGFMALRAGISLEYAFTNMMVVG